MKYKIALVHDWLVTIGGAEKVLEAIYELYPSPIYTLLKDESALRGTSFRNAKIYSSFIERLPKAKKKYRNYFPLFPLAIEQFDLSEYDIIISSSHAVAKGVLTKQGQLHICYIHTPIRYAWDFYHYYLEQANLKKGFKAMLAKLFLHYIRIWDIISTNRVNYFVANSKYIAGRVRHVYGRNADVIYPPVDVDKFEFNEKKGDFYLTVSRLVPYKRVELIVEAFSIMKNRRLVVIGDGPQIRLIKAKATNNKNIEILGYQSFEEVKNYMRKAKAFIFAAEEDFGIVPVEAQACGTPVIAYGKGGVLETVISEITGVFFHQQTPSAIVEAVKRFEQMEFDYWKIRKNAERFSKERFKKEFLDFINKKVKGFFYERRSL